MLEFFMSNRPLVFMIIFIVFLGGCSHARSSKLLDNSRGNFTSKEARVFEREILAKGGNLLVVPFTAGVGVQANDGLDHVSLMIVKGIADTLSTQGKSFKVLNAQDAQSADIVIKGRIINIETESHFPKPWQKRKNKLTLGVEGSILGVEPEQILAQFSQTKILESRERVFAPLAYDIGVEIGKILLDSSLK